MRFTIEQIQAVLENQLTLEIQQGAGERDTKLISGILDDILATFKVEQGVN